MTLGVRIPPNPISHRLFLFSLGNGQIGKALGSEPSNSVGSNPTSRIAGQQRILLFVGKFHTSFSNRFHLTQPNKYSSIASLTSPVFETGICSWSCKGRFESCNSQKSKTEGKLKKLPFSFSVN